MLMTTPLSTDRLEQLLATFRNLPRSRLRERTFMQIAGYPQLENVASNILDFYFNPANPHGLRTLFLDTLLTLLHHHEPIVGQHIELRREETTAAGKRIDLIVETDTLVIGIENKIYHTVGNPFDDYQCHLIELSRGRTLYCVLLCLQPPIVTPDLHSFQLITYRTFFARILEHIGAYVLHAREPYLTFLRDFIRTLSDLDQESGMDPRMLTYFQQHQTDIEVFLTEVEVFREDMKRKVKDLANLILIDTSNMTLPIKQGYWKPENELYHLLVYQVALSEQLGLQINVNLSPTGWRINMFNYRGSRSALEAWFAERHISVKARNTQPWRLGYGSDTLAYHANLTQIAAEVQDLLQQLNQPPVTPV
jgi:PD-(D/E)XK nuclease superfamily